MVLARIRKFGGYMSNMVMPNLGAFVGWGIIAALFIPTGWIPNEQFNELYDTLKESLPYYNKGETDETIALEMKEYMEVKGNILQVIIFMDNVVE